MVLLFVTVVLGSMSVPVAVLLAARAWETHQQPCTAAVCCALRRLPHARASLHGCV